jgi:hypothetical protein
MKRYIVLFFVLSIFSCKSKVPIFELHQEVNFVIPAGKDYLATHHFLIHDIPSTLNKTLESKNIKLSDINELYAGRCKIESVVYNSNFGIMSKISVWIYKKGDYENRKEIYYRDEIPLTKRGELKLLSSGQDIREILLSDKYEMDFEVLFKGFTTETIECRMTYNYAAYPE